MAVTHRRQKLQGAFKKAHTTKKKVAEQLGITYTRLHNIDQGHTYPLQSEVEQLVEILGVRAEDLFEPEILDNIGRGHRNAGAQHR